MEHDAQLLRRFFEQGAQDAFAELVRRKANLVYSAALRQVGADANLAEDVTQAVFLELAKQARAVAHHPTLTGWLYTTTRFVALKALWTQRRWRRREQEANAMKIVAQSSDPRWEQIRPCLDEAMHELGQTDRAVLLLRFFDGKPLVAVGAELGLAENAARMRVERALEKLRTRLARRGITSTASALGAALATQPVVAAPAALLVRITDVAASAAAGGGALAAGISTVQSMGATKITMGAAALAVAIGFGVVLTSSSDENPREPAAEVSTPAGISVASAEVTTRKSAPQAAASVAHAATASPSGAKPAYVTRPPLPPVLEPVRIGEVAWNMRSEAWKNVGRSTVGAAIQSHYWAISRGDLDYLSGGLIIDPPERAAVEALREQVSVSVRQQYPTVEQLAAFFVSSCPALDGIAIGRVLEEKSSPDDLTVVVATLEPGADRFGGGAQRFRRSPNGEWRRVIEGRDISRWREMIKWDTELSKSRVWRVGK